MYVVFMFKQFLHTRVRYGDVMTSVSNLNNLHEVLFSGLLPSNDKYKTRWLPDFADTFDDE